MKNLIAMSIATFCFSLNVYANEQENQSSNWGSNSLSSKPRSESAPPMIHTKNAASEGSMETLDTSPGVLSKEAVRQSMLRKGRSELRDDRTVFRSGAPATNFYRPRQFAYGEDIAALKGMQLELALNKMHHVNQSEIAMAKMAETKSKTLSVLTLAHQIRADHERMDTKVQAIAKNRNVALERFQLNTYEKVVNVRLNRLAAPEFETAYLRIADRNHEVAVTDLELIRQDVSDHQIAVLIDESLPTFQAYKTNRAFRARAGMEDRGIGE